MAFIPFCVYGIIRMFYVYGIYNFPCLCVFSDNKFSVLSVSGDRDGCCVQFWWGCFTYYRWGKKCSPTVINVLM